MGPAILVVEDDPDVQAVLCRVLRRLGRTVDSVGTGLEGVTRLASGGVALMVVDVGLPDIDGHEVCRLARAAGYTGGLLVISAHFGADVSRLALAAGADEFLAKPFSIADLDVRARALLA